jgi:UTP--glucose-1-phosphate uridylyltransferase
VATAVVPVAGRGTRMGPATRVVPKAMLALGDRPVIQHVVEELREAGMERIVLVTGSGGEAIRAHFADDDDVGFARQEQPRGLGDAVLAAEGAVDRPFVVALGDCLVGAAAVRALVAAFEAHGAAGAVAVEEVPAEAVGSYGIVAPAEEAAGEGPPTAEPPAAAFGDAFVLRDVVEKPPPGSAPSRLAVAGRYVLSPEVFALLRDTAPDASGEVQLTDAMRRLHPLVGVRVPDGLRRRDTGTPAGLALAVVEWALGQDGLRDAVRERVDAERDR